MLKPLFHISLTLALLTQQLQMAVVCVAFKMEQKYLTQTVCINRSNPNSKCKAHCQLSKRIHEQDKQEQENKIPLKEQTEFVARLQKTCLNFPLQNLTKTNWLIKNDEKLLSALPCELLQPPERFV